MGLWWSSGGGAVDEICTGGFELADSNLSPARLAELAKMDGAVVLSDDCSRILRANVHLVPSSAIRTEETAPAIAPPSGSRFKPRSRWWRW